MAEPAVQEGEVTFDVPSAGKPCKTWYKVVGDLDCGKTPLILLHGGPGCCHEYLLPFIDLTKQYGIPTIFYDQIGNGKGTHLPEKMGDGDFWSVKLFQDELANLVDHLGLRERGFDVLGQSWGGMLGSSFATLRPNGLRRLVVANSPAAMDLWVEAGNKLLEGLPKEIQDTIHRCEEKGDLDNPEYQQAIDYLYVRHFCRVEPYPCPEVKVALDRLKEDMTTYMTMNGPSELTVTGSLRHWTIIPELHKIEVPTFVYNGEYDEAQDNCLYPFFKHVPQVRWVTIDGTSHLSHVERREKTMRLVGEFLSF